MNDTNNLQNNPGNPQNQLPPNQPVSPAVPQPEKPHVIMPAPPPAPMPQQNTPQPVQHQDVTPQQPQQPAATPVQTTVTTPAQPTTQTPQTPDPTPAAPAKPAPHHHKKKGFRKWYRKHSGLVSLAQLILGPIALVFIINVFVFQPYQVFGSSMTPTLEEGDRLIINKLGKSWGNLAPGNHIPKRGDIIVFHTNLRGEIQLIKRVIGLPGERVVVDSGAITVFNKEFPNGFNPDKEWEETLPKVRSGDQDIKVGEDELFVSGDNRLPGGSLDSRNDLGLVQLDSVVGELIFRMFPLNKAQVF